MNDIEGYFDGPDPLSIQSLLDTLRELDPVAPEEEEEEKRRFVERLEGALARGGGGEGEWDQAAATGPPRAEVGGERQAEVEGRGEGAWREEVEGRGEGARRVEVEGCGEGAGRVEVEGHGEGSRRGVDASVTVRSPSLSDCIVFTLPAELRALPLSADAREPPPPPPAKPPGVEALKITEPTLNLPAEVWERMGRLPFKARAPEAEGGVDRTLEVPVLNWRKGKTAPVGDDSIEKEVALLPFPRHRVGAAVVPIPRLSLEQYASLRAELSVRPSMREEIQQQYFVRSVAMRRALDEHWETELAANPEARAAFEELLAVYTAWVRERGT